MSTHQSQPIESGHAPVNGINMYYEVHGRRDGVPLVLLHGSGSTIDVTFSRVLPVFADSRRVIAVEEQGHGRTSDRDALVTFEASADDVAALLRYLKVDKADIFGFSTVPASPSGLPYGIRSSCESWSSRHRSPRETVPNRSSGSSWSRRTSRTCRSRSRTRSCG